MVRVEGIEPSTSVLSGQRSTTELHAHFNNEHALHIKPKISILHKIIYIPHSIYKCNRWIKIFDIFS